MSENMGTAVQVFLVDAALALDLKPSEKRDGGPGHGGGKEADASTSIDSLSCGQGPPPPKHDAPIDEPIVDATRQGFWVRQWPGGPLAGCEEDGGRNDGATSGAVVKDDMPEGQVWLEIFFRSFLKRETGSG